MLVANNVHFAYDKQKPLFEGLDFQLESGKICGLLGKNGAGKSSLLRLISGAQFPDAGTIHFKEIDVTSRKVGNLQDIFYLQEDAELPKSKISHFLSIYSLFYPNFNRDIFYNVLDKFEVDKDEKLKNLSYGQQKKFYLAFALATQVKLLILDEPTNGLDIPSKAIFRSVVSESLGDHQSIIISTHQIRDLGQLLDRILVIQNGKIILDDDLYNISEKYTCVFVPGNKLPANTIYSEPTAGGHVALVPISDNTPGEIDIEILFNALISNPNFNLNTSNNGI